MPVAVAVLFTPALPPQAGLPVSMQLISFLPVVPDAISITSQL